MRDGPVAQWLEQGTHNPLVVGSIPTGPTTKASSAELESEAAKGNLDGTDTTVAQLLSADFEALERRGHSPQTLHAYRRYAKLHLNPAFGKRPVRKLEAWDLDALYQAMRQPEIDKHGVVIKQGSGSSAVRQAHAIMSGALG
jgi:hypothetical protein